MALGETRTRIEDIPRWEVLRWDADRRVVIVIVVGSGRQIQLLLPDVIAGRGGVKWGTYRICTCPARTMLSVSPRYLGARLFPRSYMEITRDDPDGKYGDRTISDS